MAGYVPTSLIAPGAIAGSGTATTYTPSGATTGIIRTLFAQTTTTARTVTFVPYGADGTGTRFLDAYALTVNVPVVYNLWLVVPNGKTSTAYSNGTATVSFAASGYEWS